jgi:hypothetical protein
VIACPDCSAPLVEVASINRIGRQFICGCPQTTWTYGDPGGLERYVVPTRRFVERSAASVDGAASGQGEK